MEQNKGTNSIEKAWSILNYLADEPPHSLTEIAKALHLPKTSTLRILNTLIQMEQVCFSDSPESDKLYTIDYRALRLANKILTRSTLRNQASPYLYSLAQQTSAIANLGVISGYVAVIIEKVVVHIPFPVVHSEIGNVVPAHASSVAKVILAHRPQQWVDQYLSRYPFCPITRGTIVDAATFTNELKEVAETGYATNNQESSEGVVSIAMPLFNYAGFCIAALALSKESQLHTFSPQVEKAFSAEEIATLRDASNRISFSMGYHSKEFLVDSAIWRS